MRDLSQGKVTYIGKRTNSRPLKIGLVVAVAIGAFYVVGNFLTSGSSGSGSGTVLREAPIGLVPVDVGASNVEVAEGVNLVTQTAVMRDVKYGGEATATVRRSFGGGLYILTIDATLPDPKNVSYQVWLVGGGEVVPVEYMRGSKTSWSLSLRDVDKFSSYKGVWITLERSKDDIDEEHVMEGSF